ncbi:hypothetical protein B566_EDAN003993 [Ephemera danica]|nr:hypothetical protein B566_EDAN003993 [Ephemera danica]
MRLITSYQPNYFSIEDIIATQSPLPCKIEVKISRLGCLHQKFRNLDPSSQSQHLEIGRRIDLPAWLATVLSKRRLISSELSKAYTKNASEIFTCYGYSPLYDVNIFLRDILVAEPTVVDLVKQESYFYELGRLLCSNVFGAEEEELKACLIQMEVKSTQTFQARSKEIVGLSQAAPSNDVLARERLLSREERQIMLLGRQRWTELENWLAGKVSSAELAATSVTSYRKRKRPVVEDE